MAAVVLQVLAVLVYPGVAATALAGLGFELALRRDISVLRRPTPALLAGAALGGIAAAQAAAPFSLADPADRNVLVAILALAGVASLAWVTGSGKGGSLLLAGLAAMMVALLVPAALAQDLHPEVLAAGGLQPAALRFVVGALYIVGLGAVLPSLGESPVRLWIWLPAGAMFASVFLGPPPADLLGVLEFFAVSAVAAALAAVLSRLIAQAF